MKGRQMGALGTAVALNRIGGVSFSSLEHCLVPARSNKIFILLKNHLVVFYE